LGLCSDVQQEEDHTHQGVSRGCSGALAGGEGDVEGRTRSATRFSKLSGVPPPSESVSQHSPSCAAQLPIGAASGTPVALLVPPDQDTSPVRSAKGQVCGVGTGSEAAPVPTGKHSRPVKYATGNFVVRAAVRLIQGVFAGEALQAVCEAAPAGGPARGGTAAASPQEAWTCTCSAPCASLSASCGQWDAAQQPRHALTFKMPCFSTEHWVLVQTVCQLGY